MTRSSSSRSDWPIQQIASDVAEIYAWLDRRRAQGEPSAPCRKCGRCCDFDAFGHRLFITTPEWVYFRTALGDQAPLPMAEGRCPYNEAGVCRVYATRFAGCRIFGCGLDAAAQSDLTESTMAKLKALCIRHALPYRYTDLREALNGLWTDIGL
jgi:hypothetical protein